jgi:hypothetical protein
MTDATESKKTSGKKSLMIRIVGGLLVAIAVLAMAFSFFGDGAIKAAVETIGTKTLGVNVGLDEVKLSVLGGNVELNGLSVANPEGYENETLLEMGHGYVDLSIGSLMSDVVVIDKMEFDGVTVVIEQKSLMVNNLQEIMDKLKGETKEEPVDAEEDADDEEKKAGKKLRITKLDITNVSVKIKLIPIPGKADTIDIPLPAIHLTDLGAKDEDELTTAELFATILSEISTSIAKVATDILPTEELLEVADKALEGTKEVGKDLLDAGKDIGDGLTKGLEGLFKKKK